MTLVKLKLRRERYPVIGLASALAVVILGAALIIFLPMNSQAQNSITHPLVISPATPVFTGGPQSISLVLVPGENATTSIPIVVSHQFNLTIGFLNIWNVT